MAESGRVDVVLISMPFASYKQPSLALSLLKSVLNREQIKSKVLYFTLSFAEMTGSWLYDKISTWHLPDLFGDWIFAEYLFPGSLPDADSYFRDILAGGLREHAVYHFGKEDLSGPIWEEILRVRSDVEKFLERCTDRVLSFGSRIVGLTLGVHQQAASLAIAKAIKRKAPEVKVVVGGPNVKGVMGLETIKSFPQVDVVVSGEGEVVFPEIVRSLLEEKELGKIPGVWTRNELLNENQNVNCWYAPAVAKLDELPLPDYTDFIEQWEQSSLSGRQGRLLVEGSRGCFWGEKVRCIFCGQASPTLVYRKKSGKRFACELKKISDLKAGFQICVTDEVLSDETLKEVAEVFKDMQEKKPDIVYVQVRPDIGYEDLKRLEEIGVRRLEAGIETLSIRILQLIKKGTRAIRNIAFLKWCKELGIEVVWNLLWGFPGEPIEPYQTMARIVPLLFHLDPPNFVGEVRVERFSPMYENPEYFELKDIRAYPAYSYVYALPKESIENLAYYFTAQYPCKGNIAEYTSDLAEMVVMWKEQRGRARLDVYDDGEHLTIVDTRSPFVPAQCLSISGLEREVYLFLDEPKSEHEMRNHFLTCLGRNDDLNRALDRLISMGLVIKEGSTLLSLGIKKKHN